MPLSGHSRPPGLNFYRETPWVGPFIGASNLNLLRSDRTIIATLQTLYLSSGFRIDSIFDNSWSWYSWLTSQQAVIAKIMPLKRFRHSFGPESSVLLMCTNSLVNFSCPRSGCGIKTSPGNEGADSQKTELSETESSSGSTRELPTAQVCSETYPECKERWETACWKWGETRVSSLISWLSCN